MERVLISCLLNNPSLLNVISSKIKPEYFDDVFLGKIYKKMLDLGAFSTPILAKELNVDFKLMFDIETLVSYADKTTVEGYGYAPRISGILFLVVFQPPKPNLFIFPL